MQRSLIKISSAFPYKTSLILISDLNISDLT